MSLNKALKEAELDEIELYLNQLKHELGYEALAELNHQQIADLIQSNFDIQCSEEHINLLYEPTIQQEVEDLFYHQRAMNMLRLIDENIYNPNKEV